jgi:predicted metalloprotease
MRWTLGRRSENVEDRRGMDEPGGMGIPAGFRIPGGMGGPSRGRVVRGGGIGGLGLLALLLLAWFLGVDPRMLLQDTGTVQVPYSGTETSAPRSSEPRSPEENQLAEFVSVVLGDTEDTWGELFKQMGRQYRDPTLVLFSGAVSSACGLAQSAMGPFYCPLDQKVYIDLSFYDDLKNRFGAPGDFAQAYVVAHEVGHHVQNLLGIAEQVQAAREQASSEAEANDLSVRLELQADCFAGVWANHADQSRGILEKGDVEEGLNAASAIGDDRLQRQTQGYVVPDAFTHGSSAQRVHWFRQGLETGEINACNTFQADRL